MIKPKKTLLTIIAASGLMLPGCARDETPRTINAGSGHQEIEYHLNGPITLYAPDGTKIPGQPTNSDPCASYIRHEIDNVEFLCENKEAAQNLDRYFETFYRNFVKGDLTDLQREANARRFQAEFKKPIYGKTVNCNGQKVHLVENVAAYNTDLDETILRYNTDAMVGQGGNRGGQGSTQGTSGTSSDEEGMISRLRKRAQEGNHPHVSLRGPGLGQVGHMVFGNKHESEYRSMSAQQRAIGTYSPR